MTARVAILISGGGSNMVALARTMVDDHPGRAKLVIANVPGAGGVDHARALGVAADVIDHRSFPDRAGFEAALTARLQNASIDLICLAGFMRILTPEFTDRWADRLLNIHPSLLPKYPGLDTHVRAIAAGDKQAGATVHLVTSALDAGPILGQARVLIKPEDTPATLAARVLTVEHTLYPAVLRRFLEGTRTRLDL